MQSATGIISVIQVDPQGETLARVDCPTAIIPSPGRYVLASNPAESNAAVGHCLFSVGITDQIDHRPPALLGPVPANWTPGIRINLSGPLGKGFHAYQSTRRLGIVTLSNTLCRLLPLVKPALRSGADVAVFLPDNLPPTDLPPVVEVQPLQALHEFLSWPTLLVLEIPLNQILHLRGILGLSLYDPLPCPAEALIMTPMPCATFGDCGACAVPRQKGGYHLTCKDGPVFDLNEIEW